jgi:protein-disulfide isomerase
VQPADLERSSRLAGLGRLDERQKVLFTQALNERTCDCGCELGSLAKCLRDDSHCPRSPKIAAMALDMAARNRSLAEILHAIDEENPPAPAKEEPKTFLPQRSVQRSFEPPPGAIRTGPAAAPVSIVVFGNYQCPYCRLLDGILDRLQTQYGDSLNIHFLHFPLGIHPRATMAAAAVEAAERQGAGLKMHRRLFQNLGRNDPVDLREHAAALGLDRPRFERDLESAEIQELVKSHKRLGESVGVRNIPTFFVNGRQLVGAISGEQIREVIDQALQEPRRSGWSSRAIWWSTRSLPASGRRWPMPCDRGGCARSPDERSRSAAR